MNQFQQEQIKQTNQTFQNQQQQQYNNNHLTFHLSSILPNNHHNQHQHNQHNPINLHEQPNNNNNNPQQDQSITSFDSKQHLNQQPQRLKIPQRTKSASLSPTTSQFIPLPPQESTSTATSTSTPSTKPNPIQPSKSYQHGNGTSEFVKKLYKMLEEPESESVVGWGRQKTTLVIKDQILFQKDILPKHFKHSNFASFVRQLNKYDFRKFKPQSCSATAHNHPDQQPCNAGECSGSSSNQKPGPLQWEFYHPHFRADTLSELDNIKRKVPVTRQKPTENLIQTTDCQSGTNSWETTEEIVNRLLNLQQETSSALNHLTQECKTLREELKQAHSRLDFQQRQIELLTVSCHPCPQPSQSQLQSVSRSFENTLSSLSVDLSNIQEQSQNGPVNLNNNNATSSSMCSTLNDYTCRSNLNSAMIPIGRLPNNKGVRWSRPPRVLVVEDDQICRTISSKILNLMGCKIEFACDGLNAVSRMKHQIEADEPFDLVLMDIFMPNMDGLLATSLIRKFDIKTPIISMTSNFQPIDVVKYIDIGMNDCLPKPFTKEGMIIMLQKHLFDPSKPINFNLENINNNAISNRTQENQHVGQVNTSPSTSPRRSSQVQHTLQPPLTTNQLPPSSSYNSLDMNRNLKRSCNQRQLDYNHDQSPDQLTDPNFHSLHLHNLHQNSNLPSNLPSMSSSPASKRSKV